MPDSSPYKLSILVVEDDPMISLMIGKILELNGYKSSAALDGEEALKAVESGTPDLMILDVNMPKIDGYEVLRRIRSSERFKNMPVLMITGNSDKQERIKGLELGADDFIVKPFNYDELLTRVLSTLKRTKTGIDANPLTYLPGKNAIERMVLGAVESRKAFALLKIDLNNFKAYNERYGFPRGDETLRSVARTLQSVMDPTRDFLSHSGGDDFTLLTDPERAESLCGAILTEFSRLRPGLYDLEDNRKDSIETVDRKGNRQTFPLMGISVGAVADSGGQFTSLGMINKLCDEVLAEAKARGGSSFLINRRQALSETVSRKTETPKSKRKKSNPKKKRA